jgi:hypothetical protein
MRGQRGTIMEEVRARISWGTAYPDELQLDTGQEWPMFIAKRVNGVLAVGASGVWGMTLQDLPKFVQEILKNPGIRLVKRHDHNPNVLVLERFATKPASVASPWVVMLAVDGLQIVDTTLEPYSAEYALSVALQIIADTKDDFIEAQDLAEYVGRLAEIVGQLAETAWSRGLS